jgi:ornithine cyclodeaminase/alanine dehydrogenase-like protein (mu-crystallin family)
VANEKQGDLWIPIERGLIKLEQIAELGEVAAGKRQGRSAPKQITYHKNNNGTGAADLAVTMLAYQKARELGRGIEIAI